MKTLLIMTSLGVLASGGALAAEVAVKGTRERDARRERQLFSEH